MNYKKITRFLVLLYNREITSKIFQQKAKSDPQIFILFLLKGVSGRKNVDSPVKNRL